MSRAPLTDDERRVLGIIAILILLGAGARWLERPREILPDVPTLDVAALEAASREAKGGTGSAGSSRNGGRPAAAIDPNTATAKQLEALPGVGAAVARRIIEAREQQPFVTRADMTRVRGIGPATVAKWDGLLTLPDGPPETVSGDVATAGPPSSSGTGYAASSGSVDAPPSQPAGPVDLNSASEQELQRIRGIGPALARKIVARRDTLFRFERWEQVDSIPGIGPALLVRLRDEAVLQD